MTSFLNHAKAVLRPFVRWARQHIRPKVYRVRRWQPTPALRPVNRPSDGSPEFQFLWRTSPPHWSQVFVDCEFAPSAEYPVPGSALLPLIDVYTRTGIKYLSLAHCPRTGIVFHHLLPAVEQQHQYYANEWDKFTKVTASNSPDEFMKTRVNKVQCLLGSGLKGGSKVLDVGCGYGDQLFFFKQIGCEVFGIEPSRHRAEFAQDLLGVEVLNCGIESETIRERLRDTGQRFDLIYLNQVFEHLNNPLGVARRLREFLSEKGTLLIGVPDFFSESLANYFCSIVHTHSFSANALENILRLAGYRPKANLGFPGYLYFTFEKDEHPPVIAADPLTTKMVRYVCSHFDLASRHLRPGSIISIVSSYTGYTETGLRAVSLPVSSELGRFWSAVGRSDLDQMRKFLPIKIVMPFDQPSIWYK